MTATHTHRFQSSFIPRAYLHQEFNPGRAGRGCVEQQTLEHHTVTLSPPCDPGVPLCHRGKPPPHVGDKHSIKDRQGKLTGDGNSFWDTPKSGFNIP